MRTKEEEQKRQKKYYEENKEERQESAREYYYKNKKRILKKRKKKNYAIKNKRPCVSCGDSCWGTRCIDCVGKKKHGGLSNLKKR